jgi:hypothetical protein
LGLAHTGIGTNVVSSGLQDLMNPTTQLTVIDILDGKIDSQSDLSSSVQKVKMFRAVQDFQGKTINGLLNLIVTWLAGEYMMIGDSLLFNLPEWVLNFI